MNRANPKDLRLALDSSNMMAKAGILFVCIPVLNGEDHAKLLRLMLQRLDHLAARAEAEEAKS